MELDYVCTSVRHHFEDNHNQVRLHNIYHPASSEYTEVKYEFVIELTNMSLNELNDVDSNRSSDQRPMAASLKQQQSTSSDIYCAFY